MNKATHLILVALLAVTASGYAAETAVRKPNILFIVVDDLNDWIGCLGGHPDTQTPNMDRLAARGTLFTSAHCQGTMCTPSRISFLWGKRPSSTGYYANHAKMDEQFKKDYVDLSTHFQANGYMTLQVGKVYAHGELRSEVNGPTLGQWQKQYKPIHKDKPATWWSVWDFGPQDIPEEQFNDHIIATWASNQVGKRHDKPFLLAVGFYRPHVPFFPPRRLYDAMKTATLPITLKDDWSDIPAAARPLTMQNKKIPTQDWMLEQDRWQLAVRAYLACIRWTDEQIGRVLDALDKGPNAENTIIVLISDQGYHLGEKQRWEKFSLWERTTRVPLIISVPGNKPARVGKPVELLSIYPTLCDLSGLPKPEQVEGVSLKPLLDDPNAPWSHVAITTLGQNNHAIRDERWRYIRYADGSEELYDHQADTNEWTNLAAGDVKPANSEVIKRLKKSLPTINLPQCESKSKEK